MSHFSGINLTLTGAEAKNNAWRSDSGPLTSCKPPPKCSFSVTWGDRCCAERAAEGHYCSIRSNVIEQQHLLATAMEGCAGDTFVLHERMQMKIPHGTNCQVSAQLFDL